MASIRTIVQRTAPRLTAPRTTLSRSLLRRNTSTLPTPPPPSPSAPAKKPKSATAIFYRDLIPSMLHCLALGSIVYYALELLHHTLDRELVVEELETKVRGLEGELEVLRSGSDGLVQGESGKSWWRFW